jgi:hypothetical protein
MKRLLLLLRAHAFTILVSFWSPTKSKQMRTSEAADFIDKHSPNARDILLPLLQSKEDSVRITAASALTASHPKLARSVIDHVHQTSITEAFTSAAGILTFHDVCGDYISALCKPDPRYTKPKDRNICE